MLPRSQFTSDEEFRSALRDWFAGQALAGTLACMGYDGDCDVAAKDAYAFADAMLKQRGE